MGFVEEERPLNDQQSGESFSAVGDGATSLDQLGTFIYFRSNNINKYNANLELEFYQKGKYITNVIYISQVFKEVNFNLTYSKSDQHDGKNLIVTVLFHLNQLTWNQDNILCKNTKTTKTGL